MLVFSFIQAIKLMPGISDFYSNRAMCARALGDFEQAAKDIASNRRWERTNTKVEQALDSLFGDVADEGHRKHKISKAIKQKAIEWVTRARQRISDRIVEVWPLMMDAPLMKSSYDVGSSMTPCSLHKRGLG